MASCAAYAASNAQPGAGLPFAIAVAFLSLALLPCALFASSGASFARRVKEREAVLGEAWAKVERTAVLAASAILPVVAVLLWPVVYGVGKFLEKPPVAPTLTVNVAPTQPEPRYAKPDGFDSANAWKRVVVQQEMVQNIAGNSPFIFSNSEKQTAFVTCNRGAFYLTARHLYESDQDREFAIGGGILALAWSPDDSRIVFVSDLDGAFWVCELKTGSLIPLPIPKLALNERYGLWWWKPEDVLVFSRDKPRLLSLDTLRLTPASERASWEVLSDLEKARIVHAPDMPTLRQSGKVGFTVLETGTEDHKALMANDVESLYGHLLAHSSRELRSAFSNADGTMIFLHEADLLRVLYMGLRESPPLRYAAEASEELPAKEPVKLALEKRAIRAVVTQPIVNPLNGKTVAGDMSQIKGYARVLTTAGKTCTVWIEQEWQPIREGDVLTSLSAIQGDEEYSVSSEWWAVLTKAEQVQSIPRRADVPMLLPSLTRVLKPFPEPVPAKPTPPPPQPKELAAASPKVTLPIPAPDKSPVPPPAPFFFKESFPEEGQLRKFIADHYRKLEENDLDGAVNDYANAVDFGPDKTLSREDVVEAMRQLHADWDTIKETAVEPLELKRLGGNRFSISYTSRVELKSASKPTRLLESPLQLEVILTSQGPKIVKQHAIPFFAADSATPSPPPKSPAMKVEEKPTQEDEIRAFLIAHHKKRNDRDLDGLISTYAAVSRTNGVVMTHASIRAWEAKNYASGPRILEKVVSRISLERGPNNQFAAKYEVAFEKQDPKADGVRSIANVQMEVLLTQGGPKIVSEEVRVYRREPIRNR